MLEVNPIQKLNGLKTVRIFPVIIQNIKSSIIQMEHVNWLLTIQTNKTGKFIEIACNHFNLYCKKKNIKFISITVANTCARQ